jgi:dTDP-4-dehydrorhamnose reductase
MILRDNRIDVVGTTRALTDRDPAARIQYEFPHHLLRDRIRDLRFDFAIVVARLAQPAAGAEPTHQSADRFVSSFDEMFGQLSRSTRSCVTYVSSDAVFSGMCGGYLETDKPDASDAYGSMHATAERSISAHVPNHLIVRTSFLFDVDDFGSDRRLSRMHQALTSRVPFFADTNVYKSPVPVTNAAVTIVERTLAGQTGIVHVPAERQSVHEFFESCLRPLGLTQFRHYLVARQGGRPSDTSLRSSF